MTQQGAVTMTIPGMIYPRIIVPHTFNNLFIHSFTLFIFLFLLSPFISFCHTLSSSVLAHPSSLPCSFFSLNPSSFLLLSLSPPFPRCPLVLFQVSEVRRNLRPHTNRILFHLVHALFPSIMLSSLPYVEKQSSYFSNAAFILFFFLLFSLLLLSSEF